MSDAASIFRVDGLVAVITGGGSGIGLVMARALVANGAKRVFLLGRRADVLAAAVAEMEALAAGVAVAVECDVTDKASLQAAVDTVNRDPVAAGCVNLLIANAGITGPPLRYDATLPIQALRRKLFDDASMADFTQTFEVNVTAALFTIFAFLEQLDRANQQAVRDPQAYGAPAGPPSTTNPERCPRIQSQVVVTASIASFMRATISAAAYVGSKAAIMQLSKQAATTLAPYGIRVNALAPGLFPSELAAGLIGERKPEDEPSDHPGFIPARKFGSDTDMAGTILYLASAAGSYCNGLILVMDGGRIAVTNATY